MKKTAASLAAVAVAGLIGLTGLIMAGCSKLAQKPAAGSAGQLAAAATMAPDVVRFLAKSADGKLEARVVVSGKVASVEMAATGWTWNANFASKSPVDPKNVDGEGHAILTLDTREPIYVGSMRTGLTNLSPGKHTLKVQLVQNDNTPVTEATVDFEVK